MVPKFFGFALSDLAYMALVFVVMALTRDPLSFQRILTSQKLSWVAWQ
jgi:hypothetical protein